MAAGDRHLLLVNPSAGGGRVRKLLPEPSARCGANGVEFRRVFTENLEHGCREAAAAARAGEITVVMSGDGLIGQVGGVLAGTGAALGVMPAGRGNDFARVVGIPDDMEGAAAVLATGGARQIDVGEVNGRRFLCIASCGFDSDANRIANEARWVRGHLVYVYAALRALAAWKPATFTLDARRRAQAGQRLQRCRRQQQGLRRWHDRRPSGRARRWPARRRRNRRRQQAPLPPRPGKIFKGEHLETLEVQVWRVAEVRIEADRPFAVYADGDHIADLPATVRILPAALRVIVPR